METDRYSRNSGKLDRAVLGSLRFRRLLVKDDAAQRLPKSGHAVVRNGWVYIYRFGYFGDRFNRAGAILPFFLPADDNVSFDQLCGFYPKYRSVHRNRLYDRRAIQNIDFYLRVMRDDFGYVEGERQICRYPHIGNHFPIRFLHDREP